MDQSACDDIIKDCWQTDSKNKEFIIKCDKIELTGLLAKRDSFGLLTMIVAALK